MLSGNGFLGDAPLPGLVSSSSPHFPWCSHAHIAPVIIPDSFPLTGQFREKTFLCLTNCWQQWKICHVINDKVLTTSIFKYIFSYRCFLNWCARNNWNLEKWSLAAAYAQHSILRNSNNRDLSGQVLVGSSEKSKMIANQIKFHYWANAWKCSCWIDSWQDVNTFTALHKFVQ